MKSIFIRKKMINKQKWLNMWQWLINNPTKRKHSWELAHPELYKEVRNFSSCFACKTADGGGSKNNRDCDSTCPIKAWLIPPGEKYFEGRRCMQEDHVYAQWEKEQRVERKTKLAKQIYNDIETSWEI